jgi:RHS repeat-associated protein
METDLSNNLQYGYAFFSGRRIARIDNLNQVSWYFGDHLGSSRSVFTTAGSDNSDFYPFGAERVVSTGTSTHYKFTGKERDAESRLDYFGARYYASASGRFTSRDSGPYIWKDPQTLNRYTYTRNNPLKFVDPTGKYFVISTADPHYAEFKQAVTKMLMSPQGAKAVDQIAQSPKPVFFQSGNLGGPVRNPDGSVSLRLGDTKVIETTKPSQDGSHLVGVSSGIVVTVDFGNIAAGGGQTGTTIGHETSHTVDALQAGDSFQAAIAGAQAGDAPSRPGANNTVGGTAEQFGQTAMSDANAASTGVSDDVLEQVGAEADAIIASGNAQCAQNQCNQQSGNTEPQTDVDKPGPNH